MRANSYHQRLQMSVIKSLSFCLSSQPDPTWRPCRCPALQHPPCIPRQEGHTPDGIRALCHCLHSHGNIQPPREAHRHHELEGNHGCGSGAVCACSSNLRRFSAYQYIRHIFFLKQNISCLHRLLNAPKPTSEDCLDHSQLSSWLWGPW